MTPLDKQAFFLLYDTPDNSAQVQVVVRDETIWMTQKAMADLYGINKSGISRHLANIYESGELLQDMTVAKFATVVNRGIRGEVNEEIDFYNLDAIISVGYRVNSARATRFRQWATKILNEYIRKGFVLDDDRLKQGKAAECSIDYDRNAPTTRDFYAMVQNRFHYAITGHTAAEIIYTRADHAQPNMGLQTWRNAPDGRILKSDVTVAKNYLDEKQIRQLERAVTGYFDYIEDLIERENTFNMQQFASSVNEFLSFRRYNILPDKGRISKSQADEKAEAEYDIFNRTQPITSDFDKEIKRMIEQNQG